MYFSWQWHAHKSVQRFLKKSCENQDKGWDSSFYYLLMNALSHLLALRRHDMIYVWEKFLLLLLIFVLAFSSVIVIGLNISCEYVTFQLIYFFLVKKSDTHTRKLLHNQCACIVILSVPIFIGEANMIRCINCHIVFCRANLLSNNSTVEDIPLLSIHKSNFNSYGNLGEMFQPSPKSPLYNIEATIIYHIM